MRFVDTNILLYAISRDPAELDKAKRANDILAEHDLALSVQVLQEFYVQATRASRPDAIGHQQAVLLIQSFQRFPVQDITSGIMLAALDTRQRFRLSYYAFPHSSPPPGGRALNPIRHRPPVRPRAPKRPDGPA